MIVEGGGRPMGAVARQGLLLVMVALGVLLTPGSRPSGSTYLTGLVVLALATALAVLGRSRPVSVVVLVLDVAALGVLTLDQDTGALVVLVALPTVWLGLDLRMRGVVLAGTALACSVVLPAGVSGAGADRWADVLLAVGVALLTATAVAGAATGWGAQADQLTEQGRALEAALDEVMSNRALNDAIVSTVDVGLVSLYRDGTYQSMNPHHGRLMRRAYPEGHAGRAGQTGLVYAEDRVTELPREAMPTIRAMQGEEYDDYVIWIGPEHDRRALSVSARTVRDATGEFDGAVLSYKDVTDLVLALSVKDEFVASVSHELRTPLTAIMGFLDLALEDPSLSSGVRSHLTVAKRGSVRLLQLVNDLLETAQADQGHLVLDLQPVDICDVVDEVLAEQAPRAADAQVQLRTRLVRGTTVAADRGRLHQAVANLVGNAVKYSSAGGTVALCVTGRDDQVALEVADDGIGISAEDIDRLFTRFFRTQAVRDRAIQGIGLGLVITRSIVEAHGGTVEVTSQVGVGSRFVVLLPREPRPAARGQEGGSAMQAVPTLVNPTRA